MDVTADWCVTCKANKINVLMTPEIQKALSEKDVVTLRGDWTLRSDAITSFLNKRGAAAVPFNQVYGPGLPQGQHLPTLLSQSSVLDALNQAKGDKA
ncbi:thioredoxin family protein [Dongshaea marina]|uniref:thioredoxin family protein n=1 Tax=Dongshaea marina TaxID=2047966 RepID=UPI002D7A20BD|nr:thioredoxin family protein [Dongshaea marina]